MLAITNIAAQTVAPGGTVVLPVKLVKTGTGECFRTNSNSIKMGRHGIYEIGFEGNIGATEIGIAQLIISVGGIQEPETQMIATSTAANDKYSVSAKTFLSNCCNDFSRVSVVNNGTTSVTLAANPILYVREVC